MYIIAANQNSVKIVLKHTNFTAKKKIMLLSVNAKILCGINKNYCS